MISNQTLRALFAPLIVGAAAAAPPVWADAPEIIVVGQTEAPITVVPRGLSISLGEEQFAAINAVNVEDLMKYAPNFFIRKRYIGDANSVPGFRGTHTTQSARSLVMVDGFVISNFLGNSFNFPPKWGVVGPGEVSQFDIVYGPYSARYNGHSMGGVVSITTRSPENDEAFATAQAFLQPYEEYATDDAYGGYSLEGGFGWRPSDGPFALRASYRRLENEGQPMSWYQATPANGPADGPVSGAVIERDPIRVGPIVAAQSTDRNTQDQFRLRADYEVAGWALQGLLVAWRTESDLTRPEVYVRDAAGAPKTDGLVEIEGSTFRMPAIPFELREREEFLGGLRASGPMFGWDASINLSRFFVAKDVQRLSSGFRAGATDGLGRLTEQDDPNWTTIDLTLERRFGAHRLAIGGSANQYETRQEVFSVPNWRAGAGRSLTSVNGGKSRLIGVFVEDEISIGEDVVVTPGVRIDRWEAFDGFLGQQSYEDRQDTDINGALSIQWAIAEDWAAQLSLATATRFPTVSELFQGNLLSDGTFDLDSFDPDLAPERSRDANLLLRREFDRVRLTGSFFYQRIEDALFRQSGFNRNGVIVASNQNIDEVRQIGAEAIVETRGLWRDQLDMELNAAFIDSEIVSNRALPASEGKQFPRIPYWRANGSLRYRFDEHWRIATGFRFNTRTNNALEGTQKCDTFGCASEQFMVDVKGAWTPTQRLEIALGIDNLNNDKAWAFHPFPQRTFVLEARWRQ